MEKNNTMFNAVESRINIPELEQEQLDFWRAQRIFERTTEGREDAPRYVFYEGPPTANGKPGTHHVLARAFKDMFPRFHVMNGAYVERRGGWDTHGLPVEIAVEKELGFTDKRQIEEYGVAEFNEKCRDSVFRNIKDWERLTERIAFWVDLDNAYVTFTNDYIESVWWILKQFWDKGLLYRGYKTVPYSPTSGTALSSHEVSLGYKTVFDPSIFVRFPLKDEEGVYFLAWTTTPWTLPGNAALAVNPKEQYVQVERTASEEEGDTERLILAEKLLGKVLGDPESYKVLKRYNGKELVGMSYRPLYTFLSTEKKHAYVLAGDFVTMEDGTGIVHIAPAFGEDDSRMGKEHDLPVFITVTDDGRMIEAVDKFKGMWFKDADKEIIRDLRERGLMYKVEQYEHNYPHNWRDDQPLMYLARDTWFIRATDYKDQMVALNKTIHWVPDHIKGGRFGNWLEDLKEWALGRERYWGTPLPVWVDDQNGDMVCVGSVAELEEYTGRDLTELDLHRPYVDDITFPNPKGTGGTMRRVPEVIDVWFDSGAMQVAQWGYPRNNEEKFAEQHPADYICEAVDQTRGWFYSLHAIATMLFETVAYKNVICLGHILDDKGKKMSKSRGNAIDPWDVLNTHGADSFRWYMYTAGPPGEPRRFSPDLVGEVVKKFWLTLWNTYSFFITYARIDNWLPAKAAPPVEERDLLDRWILAELHDLTKTVTQAYEEYDVTTATRPVEAFVEKLSNWYLRLSRRRFWEEDDRQKNASYATLYECLVTISHLLAPAMPFLSEALYRNLVAGVDSSKPDSVHLASWPKYDEALIDRKLIDEMELVRLLVSTGKAARDSKEVVNRQPLASVAFGVTSAQERDTVMAYEDIIKEELNVKAVELLSEGESFIKFSVAPDFSKLGRKLKGDMKAVQQVLVSADEAQSATWGRAVLNGESITIEANGKRFELNADEVLVSQKAASEDVAVSETRGYVAVIDINITDELLSERLAQEVVRRIQNLRKEADFNVDDRVEVVYVASEKFADAISRHQAYIQQETLADTMTQKAPEQGFVTDQFDFKRELEGETLELGVRRN